jgi:hypothetical protein
MGLNQMTDYDSVYNQVIPIYEDYGCEGEPDHYVLVQDGPLMDEPMVRDVNDVLEPERDEVQKLLGEVETR